MSALWALMECLLPAGGPAHVLALTALALTLSSGKGLL